MIILHYSYLCPLLLNTKNPAHKVLFRILKARPEDPVYGPAYVALGKWAKLISQALKTLMVPRDFMSHGAERDADREKRIGERERARLAKEEAEKSKARKYPAGGKEETKRPKLASSLPPEQQQHPCSRPDRPRPSSRPYSTHPGRS